MILLPGDPDHKNVAGLQEASSRLVFLTTRWCP